jgi:DNA-binding transcriptional ArsR family regulator
MEGERTVSDLLSLVGGSHHSLSQHLGLLAEQGIVTSRSQGTWRYYSCKSEEAKAVIRLLDDLAGNDRLP